MALAAGDLTVSATFGLYRYVHHHHHQQQQQLIRSSFPPFRRVNFVAAGPSCLPNDASPVLKWRSSQLFDEYEQLTRDDDLSIIRAREEEEEEEEGHESFLLNAAVNMNLLDRLRLAWKIIFPGHKTVRKSNAKIAKQRLKMILFADRCAVSDEAKKKIVSNVVNALSDFVVIESRDKVQLNVSTDGSLGTVYSVSVPVRRVKPEFEDEEEEEEEGTGSPMEKPVNVRFDFSIPKHIQ